MAKSLKLPPVNNQTRLLSFDIETNGLHGQAFAVGAVVVDAKGEILDRFSGRTQISGALDPWVAENVLPAIAGMPINYPSYKELREAFWQWYLAAEPNSDYVLVNNGYPVEYRFLLDCQTADIDARYWQHPFPVLELSSLQVMAGERPQNHKAAHNPLDDALAAAAAAFDAFRQAGYFK